MTPSAILFVLGLEQTKILKLVSLLVLKIFKYFVENTFYKIAYFGQKCLENKRVHHNYIFRRSKQFFIYEV